MESTDLIVEKHYALGLNSFINLNKTLTKDLGVSIYLIS